MIHSSFKEFWADWRATVEPACEIADEIEWTAAIMAWNAALDAVRNTKKREKDLEALEDWGDYQPLKIKTMPDPCESVQK